ncbi:MAG: hypothetical protein RIC55_36665 [Pirellulaceae bacterium]
MLLAVEIDPSWMMLAGVALLVWVLLRRVYRKRGGSPKSRLPVQSQASKAWRSRKSATASHYHAQQPLMDAPPEILKWQVEMNETARDLKAELDTKIRIVQTLVGMAREESQRLEAAIDRSRRLGLPHQADTLEQIEQITRELADETQQAARTAATADLRAPLQGQNLPLHTQREIYQLADAGETATAISTRTGLPVGDIELVLGARGSAHGA